MRALLWWRHLALAALAAGLAASRAWAPPPAWAATAIGAAILLAATNPRRRGGGGNPAAATWLTLLAATATLAGLGLGGLRLDAIAAGAAPGSPGERVHATGHVAAPARASLGELRVPLQTADGRLLLVTPDRAQLPDPAIGDRLAVIGTLAEPEPWRAAELERAGAGLELRAERVRPLPGRRGGLPGLLDRARAKAERGVAAGLDPGEEALARGFVLGQDDRIDERTREQFRRSGLAHLLAVSGQNVMLLAILVGVLLAAAGLGPRARLIAILALIAVYVPLAGAGPSIQRAGVMGAAGILAGLAGRPSDRAYLPLLAAVATLALNPHSVAEVGWQLSFAAVIGISLWAAPVRDAIASRLGAGPLPDRLARPLAEGAGLTLAATVATAPLMALHFETVSVASLPANLLALPAVAPVMWIGMLAALLGQLPLVPTAPLALLEGPLLDYIAAVADLLGRPGWAVVALPAPGVATVAAAYLALLAGFHTALAALRRRDGTSLSKRLRLLVAATVVLAAAVALDGGERDVGPVPDGALRVTALDVGQGDAILLDGPGVPAVLVDTGPPGAGLGDALRSRGVERLAVVAITHDQLDHAGALAELLRSVEVGRLLLARPAPELEAAAASAGARVLRVAAGAELRLGGLRLLALSPGPDGSAPADPNADSLVLAARFAGWTALLTGDAEAEAVRLDPGPVDVLKLAHHGSADAGLEELLDRSSPVVALVSVGAGNPHGHPAPEALAELAERGVCVLRTDEDGAIWAELARGSLRIGSKRGGGGDRCRI